MDRQAGLRTRGSTVSGQTDRLTEQPVSAITHRAASSGQPVGCVPGKPPGSVNTNPSQSSSPFPGTTKCRSQGPGTSCMPPPKAGVPLKLSDVTEEDSTEAKGGTRPLGTGGNGVYLDL